MYEQQQSKSVFAVDHFDKIEFIMNSFTNQIKLNTNLVAVEQDGLWGIVDKQAHLLQAVQFDEFIIFFYGIIAVQKDGLWGFLNPEGNWLIEPQYQEINYETGHELIGVRKDYLSGFINRYAGEVIPCTYEYCGEFDENGMVVFGDNDQYGLMNMSEDVITAPVYDSIQEAEEGMYKVEKNDLFGFLDAKGLEVIPCMYEYCVTFWGAGKTLAKKDGLFGFISPANDILVPFVFEVVIFCNDFIFIVKKDDKWGVIDDFGHEIVPVCFKELTELGENTFAALDTNGYIHGFDFQGNSKTAM